MNKFMYKNHLRLAGALLVVATLLLGAFGLARAGFLVPPQRLDVEPDFGVHTAPVDSSVSITYDQDMDPATVNPQTFAVHARQTGWLTETLSVTGGMIVLDPLSSLHAGELVQVSATTATLSLGGEAPVTPTVWQFTAAPWSGNAYFHPVQSWMNIGNRDSALGDLDGDGDLDAVTCGGVLVDVLHNDGNGTLTPVQQITLPGADTVSDVELGDLDGDGDLDAFLVDYGFYPDRILLNNGDGTFSLSGETVPSDYNVYGELGDLDGDGDLDVFVAAGGYDQGTIRTWLNDGAGGFTLGDDFDDSYSHIGVALGDLDRDGDLDAFSAGWYGTFNKVWLNDGTGAFSQHQSILGANTYTPLLGDLDGDGDLDAYFANATNLINPPDQVWLNDGSGLFTDSGQFLDTAYGAIPALGDLDADGDLDLYMSGEAFLGAPDEVWLNDGLGNFSLGYLMDESFLGAAVTLGDLDGDGDLDALVSDLEANHYVFLNAGWLEAEPIPVPEGLASYSVQCPDQPDSFYLVGGLETGGDVTGVYRYDADTNDWTAPGELADLPLPLSLHALACYERKIYVAGGSYIYLRNTLYIYDIASNTWSQGAHLPDAVWGAALGAWDGKLYLAGGEDGSQVEDQVNVYDIAEDAWTAGGGTPMPLAVWGAASNQAGPYLYIAGGLLENIILSGKTMRYNMAADAWENGPDITNPQYLGGLAVTAQHLYILGGSDDWDTEHSLDKVDMLDLADWPGGEWIDINDPLPGENAKPATACTSAVTGGEIWASGGLDWMNGILYDDNLYRPSGPCVDFGVLLAPQSLSGEGYPGTTVDYELTITNTGNITDYFSITASGLWTATVPAEVGPLAPGESTVLPVSVAIPPEAVEGDWDTAVITATSLSNYTQSDSSSLTTEAICEYCLSLVPESLSGEGLPEEMVVYTLTLTNIGDLPDTYDLTFAGNAWEVHLPLTQTTLLPGESVDLPVHITIPAGALADATDTVTVTATSQNGDGVWDSSQITTAAEAVYGVEVTPAFQEQSGLPGRVVTYTLLVTNGGNITDTFAISYTLAEWQVSLPVTAITLTAYTSTDVLVYVFIPEEVRTGLGDEALVSATSLADPSKTALSELLTWANPRELYLPLIRR